MNEIFGIFPMIVGSIYVTAGAILVGVPIGILCAVFMARFCPKKIYPILKPAIELMAGIPSIVYGFFGLVVIVPIIQQLTGTSGKGVLTASVLLGIMILPTIIGVSESAIRAVPESYYEGALALGDTHERSVFCAVLPAAKSGIMAGVILGVGRAIGETMAVIMVAGNQPVIPGSVLAGCPYHDSQHCTGDGLCGRTSQRSTDRYRCSAVCIYSDHQCAVLADQEGR